MLFNYRSIPLKSFVYTNRCNNGNFANGTTGWAANGSSISSNNGVLACTGNGSDVNPRFYQATVTWALNKKIYIRAKTKVTNSLCNNLKYWLSCPGMTTKQLTIASNPTQDQEYNLGAIGILTAGGSGSVYAQIIHNYADVATANTKVMQVQDVIIIDLTSLYGAGNEPSATDCDNIFKFVDGTKQPNFSKSLAIL